MRFLSCIFAAGVLAVGVVAVGHSAFSQTMTTNEETEVLAQGRYNSGGTAHRGSGRRRMLAVKPIVTVVSFNNIA